MAGRAAGCAAALLLYPRPGRVEVGSSIAVRIDGHYLLATAGHNIEDLPRDAQICVLAPNGREALPFVGRRSLRTKGSATVDVGWIELEPRVARASGLAFLRLAQLGQRGAYDAGSAFYVHGFPSEMAYVRDAASPDARPMAIAPSPLGFLTRPIAPEARGARHQPGVDCAVAYEAPGGRLPRAPGMSGGGIWRLERGDRRRARLVAITRVWYSGRGELCGTAIDHWLALVREDFPALRSAIDRER